MRTFRTIVIALATFASTGCEDKKQSTLRIDHVVRVFMHEPHRYTLLAQHAESKELIPYEFTVYRFEYKDSAGKLLERCGIHLKTDAARGEPMWATSDRWGHQPPGNDCVLTIHLHDPTEVEGGGWDHGKHGRGTTQVVE
ncbi:MAG: hypothetical protein Q7R80_04550 [bacterium]|nr:hypothetical protein [bacterium]